MGIAMAAVAMQATEIFEELLLLLLLGAIVNEQLQYISQKEMKMEVCSTNQMIVERLRVCLVISCRIGSSIIKLRVTATTAKGRQGVRVCFLLQTNFFAPNVLVPLL